MPGLLDKWRTQGKQACRLGTRWQVSQPALEQLQGFQLAHDASFVLSHAQRKGKQAWRSDAGGLTQQQTALGSFSGFPLLKGVKVRRCSRPGCRERRCQCLMALCCCRWWKSPDREADDRPPYARIGELFSQAKRSLLSVLTRPAHCCCTLPRACLPVHEAAGMCLGRVSSSSSAACMLCMRLLACVWAGSHHPRQALACSAVNDTLCLRGGGVARSNGRDHIFIWLRRSLAAWTGRPAISSSPSCWPARRRHAAGAPRWRQSLRPAASLTWRT